MEMLSRVHASKISVGELNPPEENILMEDPTDEDFCRIDTNSERSELNSSNATGVDDEDAAGSAQPPENLSAEKLRLKLMCAAIRQRR
ncbi:hypothetical protein PI124_g18355 [Phytophthora idaei]|nr:hypothetical protein PI125_g20445 [Phytophthora idaei]KAG3128527.1 hypothetical protein PI126_g21362 [Phytophthora idaei]KAG3236641.1 hypothetical protein PI124_g18355 [Phytophthora idaei]